MNLPRYTECLSCNYEKAHVFEEPKYGGLRGHCPNCGGNWPES